MDTKKPKTPDFKWLHSGHPVRAEITAAAAQSLVTECRQALPLEACGVLACGEQDTDSLPGNIPRVSSVYPIRNIAGWPLQSFMFDPQAWIETLYRIEKNRQKLVGLYHSHPNAPAVPSRADYNGLQYAAVASYWIISFSEPERPSIRPYFWNGTSFTPLVLAEIGV
ncbi:M67 family metallopeptidase [Paenibacillus sp. sptzw28]|uniref:Mov34/MPN/PAD-1 family protein n=1 Tax=Paenibacillus sp. sptzw28 TaxID=715179 RepID=UPI001C6EF72D|nr:M67 family metallopeptidase [Paenibacillus sp. sptzw28]QYR23442.1 M67 family metallopeptidase [Paenibacillus sp. sptzw28]